MPSISSENPERQRLEAHHAVKANWKQWGPYLSDRAWGTVREDYSGDGDAWRYFPHEHARSRAYRWNEDGIGGISDRNQYLCFSLALWNGRDPILKERFFGLSGHEGNHGEDVKEYYFYLDNTPTHSYMKMLYKYPQKAFPYEQMLEENRKRGYGDPEYELLDTGIFDHDEYFDVFIEYAKASENDLLIEIHVHNRSTNASPCTILPTLWFRNTWSWGYPYGPMGDVPSKPQLRQIAPDCIEADHPALGLYYLHAEPEEFLFTENETNFELLFGTPNPSPYVKDAFHRFIVHQDAGAVNPDRKGTKAAARTTHLITEGGKATVKLRLKAERDPKPFEGFEEIFKARKREADLFYGALEKQPLAEDARLVMRQAFAGLLWSKQLYYYDVEQWLKGDPRWPPPPERRPAIRNGGWEHLVNFDIISMPDKWEYPWYASWDLSFHCISIVQIDPGFAKRQLTLMTREWYMHPNGQLPAYEWNFHDVNPPVHAWAALKVYEIDAKMTGKPDMKFLEGIFHKLLLNFTWWVNRKDLEGHNVFQGGFLGLDNISIFDRSKPLPTGGHIAQSDATAWMAFYCVMMMKIALELAQADSIYQDSATKFFEHFQRIAAAMSSCGKKGCGLWNEEDQFFYDVLHLPDGTNEPLKVRSLVGLLPIFAMETLEPHVFEKAPVFERRMQWFMNRHPVAMHNMACIYTPGMQRRRQMGIVIEERLEGVLKYLLDENEFLSDSGIRSLSKHHKEKPYRVDLAGNAYEIHYQPAESDNGLFGGNSNWRGPVWFPINFLIIEALKRLHAYYGDEFKVEFPTGSGIKLNLQQVADELSHRLTGIFIRNSQGNRPVFGNSEKFQQDPLWRDYLLFYEYFHGDTGAGLGASHQTGWTAVVTNLILEQ